MIKTVQDMIDELQQVEDKTVPIYAYDQTTGGRVEFSMVDDDIDGQVDINFDSDGM
jgi:hypothetical protein